MANPMTERKIIALETIAQEITSIRILMEASIMIKAKKKQEISGEYTSFDEFSREYKGLKYHKMSTGKAYELYTSFCRSRRIENPITQNKFSRILHKLGYETKIVSTNGRSMRVYSLK